MVKYFQTYLLFVNILGQALIIDKLDKIYQKKCIVKFPTKQEKSAQEIFSDPKLSL